MKGYNNLLCKVLLNMSYDTTKTLTENTKSILLEQTTKVGEYDITYDKSNNNIVIDSPKGNKYFWEPSTGKWTKQTYNLGNEIYTDLDPSKSFKTIKFLNYLLKTSGIGSVYYIKNTEQGNKFRSWVNQKDPNFAKSINLSLTGPYDNEYIRRAWVKYGQDYKNVAVSKEYKDSLGPSKSTLDHLKSRGFDPEGAISDNHAYALSVIRATKNLTTLIANKIGGEKWFDFSICVKSVKGSCNPGRYAIFDKFSTNMGSAVNNFPEKAKGMKPPYYMILENFYFDIGKIKEDLDRAFKYDKNAYKSDLFPDGWWPWFTFYFGIDNYNTISSKISGISYLDLPKKVESKVKIKETESLLDILSDGHTLLDLASIAVLLLPPPIGIIASSTIDGVNALWYLNEGHPYLAALTAIGIFPGIKQAKLISTGAKMDTKLIKFVEDLAYVSKSEKLTQSKIDDIFAKHTKGLSDAEKLTFGKDLINISKNADKKLLDELYKTINKWNTYSNYDKNLLKDIFKDEKNIKLLQKYDGNLDNVLKELRATLDKDQQISLCIQLGLYAVVSDILPMLVPEDLILEVYKTGLIGFEEQVNGEGYDWDKTIEIFAVSNKTTNPKDYQKDLSLLELAWKSGWRPYTKKGNELVINTVPKKYQTELYKKFIKNLEDKKKTEMQKKTIYVVKGEDVEIPDNVEVVYVDSKEEAEFYGGWESEKVEDDDTIDYDAIDKYLNKK